MTKHKPEKLGGQERMELHHKAVAGYRPAFVIVLAVGIAYLVVVFLYGAGGAH